MILNDTDHLWGHGCELAWIWKSFTRGMNVLFMDPWEPIPADMPGWQRGNVSLNRRYYHLWDQVRRKLGYARRWARRMDLNACVPHDDLCTLTYCLANAGYEHHCFFPSGGHEGIDLWDASGEFSVEAFSPATGETIHSEAVTGSRRYALGAPFDGPAVLYLQRKGRA